MQTSMLGSILSNTLLVLGSSFLAAGFKFKESSFQQTAAQDNASLMMLACSTIIIPAAYHASKSSSSANLIFENSNRDLQGLLTISRGTAVVSSLFDAAFSFRLKDSIDLTFVLCSV